MLRTMHTYAVYIIQFYDNRRQVSYYSCILTRCAAADIKCDLIIKGKAKGN